MLQEFLNTKAVASYLDLKRSTLYSLVEQRLIPHYRIGRQIRFKKSDVDEWLEQRKRPIMDISIQVKKVIGSIEKKADIDVDGMIEKAIEGVAEKRYTSSHGKPDRKGRRKEA